MRQNVSFWYILCKTEKTMST